MGEKVDTELQLNVQLDKPQPKERRKSQAVPQQTLEEAWDKIFSKSTTSPLDLQRLKEVRQAIQDGELGVGVDNLNKFSRAQALRLYKELKESQRSGIIADMITSKPRNYHLVTSIAQLEQMCQYLYSETEIAVDTETCGLSYDSDYIVGVSLTLPKSDYHCYIPIRHNVTDVQLPADTVFARLKPVLENQEIKKYFFNYKFDAHMLLNEGIKVQGLRMDGAVAIRLLSEAEPSYALKNLATKYGKHFGFEDRSSTYEELFGKGGFGGTPLDIGTVYACKDTHVTYRFCKWIESCFDKLPKLQEMYFSMELPITEIVFEMERVGCEIDLQYAQEYTEILGKEIDDMGKKLQEVFGDINLGSNQQLAALLFDQWRLDDISKKRSVGKDVLEQLAQDDDRLSLMLEYRKMNKLYNTYLLPLPQKIWKRDGRLHGQYNQCGTTTGRFSSKDPNMQNIDPKARPMFTAPEGKVLMSIDLSQIEPRMLAFMSKDSDFQYPYHHNIDLYSTLASTIFKKPIEECCDGSKYRKMMKVGLLAKMYGVSVFEMSKQLGITVEEAQQFMDDFDTTYPVAKQYMDSLVAHADQHGYVETFLGRKRRFQGHKEVAAVYHATVSEVEKVLGYKPKSSVWKEEKLKPYKYKSLKERYGKVNGLYNRVARQAVNSVIQGSAADYLKLALLNVSKVCKQKGEQFVPIGNIHDELLLEVPRNFTYQDYVDIDKAMTGISWFKFPIKTDCVVMQAWGKDEIKIKEWFKQKEVNRNDR